MKALIVDDELLARALIKKHLSRFPQFTQIEECSDAISALKTLNNYSPDVLFLDIQMPEISGMEMLEIADVKAQVVFTTAYDNYAVEAFEKNAIDYLLKPISEQRFDSCVEKLLQNVGAKEETINDKIKDVQISEAYLNRIVIKENSEIHFIPLDQISYMEAYDDYVKFYTTQGKMFIKHKTMKSLERTLNPKDFVRIHRSYIIRIDQITKIEPYEKDKLIAILKDKSRLPISKTGHTKLKNAIGI